jgi:hypothetical protein
MANGENSKRILKVINGLMIFLGLIVVGFSTWALIDSDGVLHVTSAELPKHAFWASLFFGIFVIGISGLGSCSTKTDSKLGFAFYIFIVFVALVAQISAATYLGMKYGVISDAALVTAGTSEADITTEVKTFETAIVDAAIKYPDDWIKTQNLFKCCGYDARHMPSLLAGADKVDTGKLCTDNAGAVLTARGTAQAAPVTTTDILNNLPDANGHFFCKDKVVSKLEDLSLYVGITAGVLAFIQLICLLAACRLACCVSSKDGGYMEEWRPSTKKEGEEYAANDLTGMGAGQGGPMMSEAV